MNVQKFNNRMQRRACRGLPLYGDAVNLTSINLSDPEGLLYMDQKLIRFKAGKHWNKKRCSHKLAATTVLVLETRRKTKPTLLVLHPIMLFSIPGMRTLPGCTVTWQLNDSCVRKLVGK